MKQLVLVTGAAGQLGEAMAQQLAPHHEVVAMSRAELDVTDVAAVAAAVGSLCPDVIVNCAAYTDVDGAERHPEAALAVNAWAVRALATAATEAKATLVHFSTDFVFDGTADRPYSEDDDPNPRGAYAASKLLGEWFAATTPSHYVLRVESLFGGATARSSIDRMVQQLQAGQNVRAFADRTVSPSFVEDVVKATATLIVSAPPAGLYHCVNTGCTTWSGVARELATLLDVSDASVLDVPMASAALVAPRPQYAALANAMLAAAGAALPTWQDALGRYVRQLGV
jgi:dTDP-4-dehydrorhamnose reductase